MRSGDVATYDASLPGLVRQSSLFRDHVARESRMRGSSPRMTPGVTDRALKATTAQ